MQWLEISKKWNTRLSASFAPLDSKSDGNIEYDRFEEVAETNYDKTRYSFFFSMTLMLIPKTSLPQMMQKLSLEKNFPSCRIRINIFARMCHFFRIDSEIFVEVSSVIFFMFQG